VIGYLIVAVASAILGFYIGCIWLTGHVREFKRNYECSDPYKEGYVSHKDDIERGIH